MSFFHRIHANSYSLVDSFLQVISLQVKGNLRNLSHGTSYKVLHCMQITQSYVYKCRDLTRVDVMDPKTLTSPFFPTSHIKSINKF